MYDITVSKLDNIVSNEIDNVQKSWNLKEKEMFSSNL